jgi:hypothetical protein
MAFALFEARVVLGTLLREVVFRLPGPPAKVSLRSFMFSPAGGPRVVVEPPKATKPSSLRASDRFNRKRDVVDLAGDRGPTRAISSAG